MEIKLFEVRDRGTFVPCIAIRLMHRNVPEEFLLRRAGYAAEQISPRYEDEPYVLLSNLHGGKQLTYDAYAWDNRTMATAHLHMIGNWNLLQSGDVIDVEFIRGETQEKKRSERER